MHHFDWVQIVGTLLVVLLGIAVGAQMAPIMSWVERKQMAVIQRRIGPNRVGFFRFRLFGLGQPIADAIKLLNKEDFIPPYVHKLYYLIAPIVPVVIGLAVTVCIPWGSGIWVEDKFIPLQAIHVNGGFLVIFALSALSVYGVSLAGWASNNKYSLLGGLRASAQMISYEVSMGMSLIPIVFLFGTFDLQEIIRQQQGVLFGFLPNWGIFYAPVSFVIFLVTVFAETNRLPFDLAEGDAELVGGFLTEYGSMRWSLFFLGEYAMLFTLSVLTISLFLGGYEIPWLSQPMIASWIEADLGRTLTSIILAIVGFITLMTKVVLMMWFFVQVRFTLPRFRYDQLMRVGWVYMIPFALLNLVVTAALVALYRF